MQWDCADECKYYCMWYDDNDNVMPSTACRAEFAFAMQARERIDHTSSVSNDLGMHLKTPFLPHT